MKNCVRCKHFNDYCSMTGQEKNCPDFEPLEEKPSFEVGDNVSYNGEYGTVNKIDTKKKQALVRFFGCTRWLRLNQIEKSKFKNFKTDL